MTAPILFSVLALLASFASAKPTETTPATQTFWDQMMAAQAAREMRTGYQYMESRQYEQAVREFAKAVLSNPSDATGHLMLGSAYYWTGQIQMAEAEFREALRLDPKSAQGHLLLGIVFAWKGDMPNAYKEFEEGARLDPERADLQMNLGSLEETMGRFPEALVHFRRAVALEPEHPLYHFQIGMLYRRLGRDADAADSLRAALKRFPEFEDAMLELGAALERLDRREEAEDLYKRAVRLKARDSVARLRLGRAYLLGGEPAKARAAYTEAFHLTPESGGGLALSVSFGGPGGAQPSEADKPKPGAPPARSTDPADPLNVLSRNLERIPLDQDAALSIEMAFLPRPKLERAKASEAPSSLKKALAEAGKPARPGPSGVRREYKLRGGKAEERAAEVKKIIDDLDKVMKQVPPDNEVRFGMNLQFTSPSFKSSDPAAGRSDAGNAKVSYQPRQVGNDMGLWVMGTGWMALVEEVLPEAGEAPSHPDTADWWVTMGLGHAVLGNAKSALDAFDRALALDPKDELAWLGRGVAMVESGRDAEAETSYRKALELNPKNRAAKEGLKWLLAGKEKEKK